MCALQYPAWLSNHRDEISREDYTRYERQHQLMLSIVEEFESEQTTDSDDVKRQRFERVLDIMQQMQSLGHPPKELIGELVTLSGPIYQNITTMKHKLQKTEYVRQRHTRKISISCVIRLYSVA